MEERNKLDRLNELKAKVYDMLAAKQQIEQQMAKLNQAIAQEQQRLRQIEIEEAKKKAKTNVKSVDQQGGITTAKVNVKNSKIKNSNIVVDSKGAKTKPEIK